MPSYKKGKKQLKKPASRKNKKGGSFCKMVGCADKEESVSPENEDISATLEEDKEVSPSPEDEEVSPSPEKDEEVSPSPEKDEDEDEDDMEVESIEKESISGGKRKTQKSKPKSKKGGKTMKKLTEWTKLVSEIFKKNRAKNSTYMFKQALKEAKKIYKKK